MKCFKAVFQWCKAGARIPGFSQPFLKFLIEFSFSYSVTSKAACLKKYNLSPPRWHSTPHATPQRSRLLQHTASIRIARHSLICSHNIWLQISLTALNDALPLPLALLGRSSVDAPCGRRLIWLAAAPDIASPSQSLRLVE